MKKNRVLISFCLIVFVLPFSTLAHPGNTDSSGCHTCRTNCAKWGLSNGEYHCHRAKSLPQPIEPVKSKFSETGGVTVPAPEYKQPVVKKVKQAIKETKPVVKEVKQNIVNSDSKVELVNKNNISQSTKKENNSWISRLFKSIFDNNKK